MLIRIIPLVGLPLIALFLGWSIQPIERTQAATGEPRQMWPAFEVNEFHATLEDPSLAPKPMKQIILASNQ